MFTASTGTGSRRGLRPGAVPTAPNGVARQKYRIEPAAGEGGLTRHRAFPTRLYVRMLATGKRMRRRRSDPAVARDIIASPGVRDIDVLDVTTEPQG